MDTGRMTNLTEVRRFLCGGNATFTLVNPATGNRFTYKAQTPKETDLRFKSDESNGLMPIFVKVLRGQDNQRDYTFLGTIWRHQNGDIRVFNRGKFSKIGQDATSFLAFNWFINQLVKGNDPLTKAEFWHEGRCGRCNRKLTVPESIASGFGPECIKQMGA